MIEFDNKVAVVTGAASGIGLAMAKAFYQQGMRVVMADIERQALTEASTCLNDPTRVLAVVTDVSDPKAVDALADAAFESFGSVHLLCNNAGVFVAGASWECSDADYRWLIDVNVMGIANGIRSFVPRMIAAGEEGHIVNTASMAAMTTMPFSSIYCMSKAAALSLSECLFKELEALAPQLGVSVLCPELINTSLASAQRNRPDQYSQQGDLTDTEMSKMTEQAISEGIAGGIEPAVMAERVLQGIKAKKFYLLPQDGWKKAAMIRQDEIRQEANPTFTYVE
ncbi:MAG: SDR family NAD(P)-dependent oxidoreductase [Pseudomonadota bacterium]|nr:SDR family NAD(P)-dependent oxidoreductase [Pseudomonadota bacterium]